MRVSRHWKARAKDCRSRHPDGKMMRALVLCLAVGADALSMNAGATPKTVSNAFARSKVAMVARGKVIEEPEPDGAVQVVQDVAITALRLGTCALMVHHGIDKLTVRSSLPGLLP